MASRALIQLPADQTPFGIACPPGPGGYATDGNPRIPNKVALDVERDGCRREREGVGGSVPDFLIRGSSVGAASGNACSNDQFIGCQRMLDIRCATWLDMQVVNRNGSRAARAHNIE